jgi:hypothetical protein
VDEVDLNALRLSYVRQALRALDGAEPGPEDVAFLAEDSRLAPDAVAEALA